MWQNTEAKRLVISTEIILCLYKYMYTREHFYIFPVKTCMQIIMHCKQIYDVESIYSVCQTKSHPWMQSSSKMFTAFFQLSTQLISKCYKKVRGGGGSGRGVTDALYNISLFSPESTAGHTHKQIHQATLNDLQHSADQ